MMKVTKNYMCHIGGKSFQVNDEKTHVLFHSTWCELKQDDPSEMYFRDENNAYRYLDSTIIDTE
jgi:hypothetical protein